VGSLPGLGSLYVAGKASLPRRLLRGVYENLQRLASRSADLTIFQNQDDAREFVSRGVVASRKATIIPGSGVRTEVFDPARVTSAERQEVRASLGVPPDAVLVTMVSRIMRTKGVGDFAAAARTLRESHPRAHFLLVGQRDETSMDRLTAAEWHDLQSAVHCPGSRRDVPHILAASDIFVLPSYYREGIPRALLEAASMGLPIVTTKSPGCAEVVDDGVNGFLVPVRDPQALAAAVGRLLSDAASRRRCGAASRRLALDRFDLNAIAQQTRSLYRRLLTGRKPFLP
jgi:glycosyltransferase involved in cell wall biosynthesis